MILVILAALAAGITSFSTGQHLASAQDIQSTRALFAARAGLQWGLFRALRNNTCDSPAAWAFPDSPDLSITVVCNSVDYSDGIGADGSPRVIRVFDIRATAANGATVASPVFVERQFALSVYCEWNGVACTGP